VRSKALFVANGRTRPSSPIRHSKLGALFAIEFRSSRSRSSSATRCLSAAGDFPERRGFARALATHQRYRGSYGQTRSATRAISPFAGRRHAVRVMALPPATTDPRPTVLRRPDSLAFPSLRKEGGEHPRSCGWVGTTALAMGGSNQSLFLIGALIVSQGSAAVP